MTKSVLIFLFFDNLIAMSKQPSVSSEVRAVIDSELIMSPETLQEVMIKFEREIKKGLKKSTHKSAETKCFVTYVQNLPNGTERGKVLALDLGGTNFRVLLIHLKGEDDYEFESKIYAIPQSVMLGSGVELFDHIARCLAEFTHELNIHNEVLPLGFTFSFPCQQVGLTKGLLIKWTKGFNCEGVVNQNVVELLEDAIKKRTVRKTFSVRKKFDFCFFRTSKFLFAQF